VYDSEAVGQYDDDATLPTTGPQPESSKSVRASRTSQPLRPEPMTRYDVGAVLGKGGMGEVRLARDTRIDREVAVKLMRAELRDSVNVARFFREAHVQGALEHPSVVPVHDLGIDADGTPYFVMKRLAGVTLAQVLEGSPLSRREILDRLVSVCLAVELAHQRGVIHRDLKPANIMLGDFGETYVLDWGLARVGGDGTIKHVEPMSGDLRDTLDERDSGETQAGELMGTPGYMAPEQARGATITPAADVFSLGCILFEILAGEAALPRGIAAIAATLGADFHSPASRAPDADIPPELDQLCIAATSHLPAERPTAQAFADAIRKYLNGDRDEAARKVLASAHAATARTAMDQVPLTDANRALAMKEAGRALALDRKNADAQALLASLLVAAPDHIPAEALAAADLERAVLRQKALKQAISAYASLVPLIAILFAFHVRVPAVPLVTMLLCATVAVMAYLASRTPLSPGSPWFAALMITNSVLHTVGGLMFGPLLVMPVYLVGSLALILGVAPITFRPSLIVAAHVLPIGVALALELTGITPRTFVMAGGSIQLTSWVIDFTPMALVIALVIALASQFLTIVAGAVPARQAEELARDRAHAQAWHLKQLDPRDRSEK